VSDRPFSVLGIQQIAVGSVDKGPLRKLWIDMLGLAPSGQFRSERENVDEDIAVAGSGPLRVEVDLMQPIDPDKRPKVHDPALNHIREGAGGHDVCFIHPKGNEAFPIGGAGVLIELVQAPDEVIEAFRRSAEA
jgi:lactoylglutathione lyase